MKGDYVKEGQKLPMYGKGPVYVYSVFFSAVLFAVLHAAGVIRVGNMHGWVRVVFWVVGLFLIAEGLVLWFLSTGYSNMREHIADNTLNTSGVYAWVRNPMHGGIMIMSSGIAICCGNVLYLILPVVYYVVLTVMQKNTEEKWLLQVYGKEYADYCKRVNRCFPWFPKKQ